MQTPRQPLLCKMCDACRQKGHHYWRRRHPLAVAESPGCTSIQSIGHSVGLASSSQRALLSMLPTSPRQRLAHYLLSGVLENDVKHHTLIFLHNRKTIQWLISTFLVILFSKVLRLLVILHVLSLVNAPLHCQISVTTKPPIFRIFSSLPFHFIVSGPQRAQRASPVHLR